MTSLSIALGAGGARGLAHIHLLRALDDLGVTPNAVSGTSIGSILGVAYCSGMDARQIQAYVEDRLGDRLRLVGELFKTVPTDLETFLSDGGLRFGELNLETLLDIFLPDRIPQSFEELDIPFYVLATDYYEESDAVLTQGLLRPALAASACMPAVFSPVRINGRYLTDGSATNPVPLDVVHETANHVIGVDVAGGAFGNPNEKPKIVDVAYAANGMMQQTMARQMVARYSNTVLLRAQVASYRPLDFWKAEEILTSSEPLYEQAKRAIEAALN
ncbi:MAG: patatin-like phospholipase family protein [Pseudomonadota bacterium]